jgi:hypothetical protein
VQVARVGVLTFCNLSNKPNLAAEMVDLGMLKVVQSLKLQAWNDEVNISFSLCLSFLISFDIYYFSLISLRGSIEQLYTLENILGILVFVLRNHQTEIIFSSKGTGKKSCFILHQDL